MCGESTMETEELIKLHRESLRRKVSEDPFRPERLKARLLENRQPRPLTFRRTAVLYGLLLMVFTFINFMVIGGLIEKQAPPVLHAQAELISMDAWASHLTTTPGSINQAFEEVMNR